MTGAIGCARPTGSVVGAKPADKEAVAPTSRQGGTQVNSIMVGRSAPDFAAPAYHKGAFTQVKLSDLLGK